MNHWLTWPLLFLTGTPGLAAPPPGYQMVWSDEFEGNWLDGE